MAQALFGLVDKDKAEGVLDRLDEIQRQVESVEELLHDSERTEFAIVSIPTAMSVLESARLAGSLQEKSVRVNAHVINQVLRPGSSEDDDTAATQFLERKATEQSAMMERANGLAASRPSSAPLTVIRGPWLDLEVRGVPALQYFGSRIWGM